MSYSKPEVIRLVDSAAAIQSTAKTCTKLDNVSGFQTASNNAYEVDE